MKRIDGIIDWHVSDSDLLVSDIIRPIKSKIADSSIKMDVGHEKNRYDSMSSGKFIF